VTTIRFLHSADWQLGMRRHFLSEEALPRYMQARIDAIATMAEAAREVSCDFAVVCGDVFESNLVDRRTLGRALEALGGFSCPIYLLPGNHDPLDAGSIYKSREFSDRPQSVRVLDCSSPVTVRPGLELVGVPWHSKHPRRDLVADVLATLEPTRGVVRICAGHGIVDSLSPDRDDPACIRVATVEEALASGRIHFLALGDRHSVTEVAPRIWYSGTPEPTAYRETDPGFALIVELEESGEACHVARREIGRWRFRERSFELAGEADTASLAELEEWLDGLDHPDRTVVKLRLSGSVGLSGRAHLDTLLEGRRELLAGMETRDAELVTLPDAADLGEMDLSGYARPALERLRALANDPGDPEKARTARDALALLYRLAAEESR